MPRIWGEIIFKTFDKIKSDRLYKCVKETLNAMQEKASFIGFSSFLEKLRAMVIRSVVISVILCLFINFSTGREPRDCYANDVNPYLKFATKTAYEFVYGRPKLRNNGASGCEPVQLWFLARHGTRYPGKKDIRALSQLQHLKVEIIKNHEERKSGKLCYADLNSLKAWKFNAQMTDANLLTKQGYTDFYFLAKRIRSKYPSLFQQGYSPNLFQFRHTSSERTRQSAQAFAEGLFDNTQGIWIPPAVENDTVIKPYENCTYWIKNVEENPENQKEADLFRLTEGMRVLIHNVSLRLGFSYDLSADTISSMYDMCRYDKAWNVNERSPWCAAFIKDELKILEYLEDIKAYYDAGYGEPLNLKLGCAPLKDMLERFRRLEDENAQNVQEPVGVFYFTHASMLMMTLAKLEVASHGIPLRHDNYYEQANRDWRTSDLAPFAANLAAVFYKCKTGEYNRVMFFLNEFRIDYEGCDLGLCSWQYIRNKFADIPDSNLEWCKNIGHINKFMSSLLLLLFLRMIFKVLKGFYI